MAGLWHRRSPRGACSQGPPGTTPTGHRRRARSALELEGLLVLSPDAPPGRAQQVAQQGVALLLAAGVDVVDHPDHEFGGYRVKGPVVRFHHRPPARGSWPYCIKETSSSLNGFMAQHTRLSGLNGHCLLG